MNDIDIFTQMPVKRLIEAVKLAQQPRSTTADAAKWLCDWWNEESGCAEELRCAAVPLIWVSEDAGLTYMPGHPNHGPAEPFRLFSQPLWSPAVAACGKDVLVAFLRKAEHSNLDNQGFFHTYLVNGAEYESLGVDFMDYRGEANAALQLFWSRFPGLYEPMYLDIAA